MKFKLKLDPGAYIPEHAHEDDAGYDLRTPREYKIQPRGSVIIDTGVHIAIPKGMTGFLKSKSGLYTKLGLISTGVIDSSYTGSIVAKLVNTTDNVVFIDAGSKITQIVFLPIVLPEFELVDELDSTERGDNGFGSTGL